MRLAALFLVALSLASTAHAQSPTRAQLRAQIDRLRAELVTTEAQLLAPAPSDLQACADLLSRPESGVFRLLPGATDGTPAGISMRGGGSYFSFSRLTHEYGYGSDIELVNGEFSVGFAGADYGFLVRLPDQPLLSITLESPGVSALAAHVPPSSEPGAREQQRLASTGYRAGDLHYVNRVPAVVGAVYVLRSVGYDDADVLVCFETLRQDEDGSMVLAWHLLKRYPKPELDRRPT